MVPPDGARSNRIPTLSWDSVVDTSDRPAADVPQEPGGAHGAVDAPITLQPLSLDLAVPVEAAPAANLTITSLHLEAPPAATPKPAEAAPVSEVVGMPVVGEPSATANDAPVTIRTTPPAVIVPAIGDVTSGPDQLTPAPDLGPPPDPAPTPDPASAALPAPALAPEPPSDALPEIREATPIVQHSVPMLPSVSAPVPRSTTAAPFEFDPASVAPVPTRQTGRRSTRTGVKLVATVIVLGAVVAAGIVFGQSYLFPGEWEAAAAPYADAVEAGRAVEFTEPLAIVAEPTAEFTARLQTHLASVSTEELAQWRALGLVSGVVDDGSLAEQLAGWQDALYSTVDGQVYHDLDVTGGELDAQLVREMTAASLDQEFGWSVEQSRRTLDAAAATSAEVLRQARLVQQSSPFDADVAPVSGVVAATLPTVIGYRMLAPHVFAEFDASIETGERTNPLADLGVAGPGVLGRDAAPVAAGPAGLGGDTLTTSPMAKDRSFWYLVLAGYLDTRTAYSASEAVVESALTGAVRGETQCVAATFSGGDVEQTATLRSALVAWADAAPVEMASSFQVLADGTLQLVSCDPGTGFAGTARPGVARELLAWRMAELTTAEAVVVGGGGEAELTDAWAFVQSSPVALDVMALPASASPAEMAVAAREAFDALFTAAD